MAATRQARLCLELKAQGYKEKRQKGQSARVFTKDSKSFCFVSESGDLLVGASLKDAIPCAAMQSRLLIGMAV